MAAAGEDTGLYIHIPRHRNIDPPSGNCYTVYCIEVFNGTQRHIVEKRYREFNKLRKKLNKVIKPHPKFPPKKMAKNVKHVIKVRQRKLERYLNAIAQVDNTELLTEFFRFLDVIPIPLYGANNEIVGDVTTVRWDKLPPIAQPCVELNSQEILPDNVTDGVLSALYDIEF